MFKNSTLYGTIFLLLKIVPNIRAYKNRQKVNKSISFNTIKQKSFELFYGHHDIDRVLKEMQKLFITTPTAIRPDRPSRKRLDKNKDKSTI
jgi:hypothetical protein